MRPTQEPKGGAASSRARVGVEVGVIDDLLALHESLRLRLTICEPDEVLIVNGARLIDGLGSEPRDGMSLLAKGGVIERVGPDSSLSVDAEPGATVLDGRGLTLMPGMIDAHFHFTGRPKDPAKRELEANDDIRVLRAARDGLILLNAGFTAVKSMGHGRPAVVDALKQAMGEGFLVGPTIRHCGWAFSQSGGHGINPGWPLGLVEQRLPRSAFADGIDGCRVAVRRNFGEGADFVKLYATQGLNTSPQDRMNIPNYTFEELKVMADEAHRHRTLASAHATGTEGAINAVRAGIDTIEHGPDCLDEDGEELLDLMVEKGTLFVPTLAFASKVQHRPTFTPEMKERAARRYQGKLDFVRAAMAKGVRMAAGTDYSTLPLAGRNAEEIKALHEAGLSTVEAIAAGTSRAAEAMGLGHLLGAVRPGLATDLLLVDGDPSADIDVLCDPERIVRIVKARHTWRAPAPL